MSLGPLTLENALVRLRPFAPETDGPALHALAEAAPEIFSLWSYRGPGDWVGRWIDAIGERTRAGTMLAFAVTRAGYGACLGITSYLDPSETNKSVEIGMTCYAPEAQGTAINPACKHLLLGHAFDRWGARRVQFQVDNRNERSKAAVLKLGAQHEGVLRNHRTLQDGYVRDTAFFSILDREWPQVRDRLRHRLDAAARAGQG